MFINSLEKEKILYKLQIFIIIMFFVVSGTM